eukprot:TRINITY_DN13907_c0_g1_i1.p1 TRINITY_DN13907_c0_g1~~TRINITY_DN13907_c0_g1_i1.p1  ORF type:complete len:546 (-),score=99.98 TRINITY_DN13907_c0_g1_i1:114-1751(-)
MFVPQVTARSPPEGGDVASAGKHAWPRISSPERRTDTSKMEDSATLRLSLPTPCRNHCAAVSPARNQFLSPRPTPAPILTPAFSPALAPGVATMASGGAGSVRSSRSSVDYYEEIFDVDAPCLQEHVPLVPTRASLPPSKGTLTAEPTSVEPSTKASSDPAFVEAVVALRAGERGRGAMPGGALLRSGELVVARSEDKLQSAEVCTVLMFSTGLYMIARESGELSFFAWSPFTILSEGAGLASSVELDRAFEGCCSDGSMAIFSFASPPARGSRLILATRGEAAAAERRSWLADASRGLRLLAWSYFPDFRLCVEPIAGVPATSRRLLAGYLLLRGRYGSIEDLRTVYCELQAPQDDVALLAVYEDESCSCILSAVAITGKTNLLERPGIDCSCFAVAGHAFCARLPVERQIWLRALANLRTRLQNGAPDPTCEELSSFREAVAERLAELRAELDREPEPPQPAQLAAFGARSSGSNARRVLGAAAHGVRAVGAAAPLSPPLRGDEAEPDGPATFAAAAAASGASPARNNGIDDEGFAASAMISI